MNLLIVEDEELAVHKLQKTLAAIPIATTVVGTADSIASTVEWLETNAAPDLILMDVELADGQSFDVFNRTEVPCPVIFTTSYDEFALKAFKVNAVDYLLKPIQKEELEKALRKHLSQQKAAAPSADAQLQQLMQAMQQSLAPKDYRKRFLVKHGQKLVSIEVGEIAYFYSDGRLNFFKTADNRKFVVDYTMDELEQMLNPDDFFRISRSFYVRVNSIEKIDDYFGNRLLLGLKPAVDKEATVSRERVQDFKKWMGK